MLMYKISKGIINLPQQIPEISIWHFMQIVSIHWRQFAWNVQIFFQGKIRKYFNISSAKTFYSEC